MKSKTSITWVGLFVFFFLLFNSPLINLPKGLTNGVPSLVIYIVTAWVALIIIMFRFSFRKTK